jgi:hypothetical protein
MSVFSGEVGWGPEDTEKARAMLRRERTDGSKRFTRQEVADYTGMPLERIEAIARRLVVGEVRRFVPSRIREDDEGDLFYESSRARQRAIDGSVALAERIRAVYG